MGESHVIVMRVWAWVFIFLSLDSTFAQVQTAQDNVLLQSMSPARESLAAVTTKLVSVFTGNLRNILSRKSQCPGDLRPTKLGHCACPGNSVLVDGTCQACPSGTEAVGEFKVGWESCVCRAGFSGNITSPTSTCTACGEDTYGVGGQCVACPSGSSTYGEVGQDSCKCGPDMYGGMEECVMCPENTFSKPGSKYMRECLCKPGYVLDYLTSTAICVEQTASWRTPMHRLLVDNVLTQTLFRNFGVCDTNQAKEECLSANSARAALRWVQLMTSALSQLVVLLNANTMECPTDALASIMFTNILGVLDVTQDCLGIASSLTKVHGMLAGYSGANIFFDLGNIYTSLRNDANSMHSIAIFDRSDTITSGKKKGPTEWGVMMNPPSDNGECTYYKFSQIRSYVQKVIENEESAFRTHGNHDTMLLKLATAPKTCKARLKNHMPLVLRQSVITPPKGGVTSDHRLIRMQHKLLTRILETYKTFENDPVSNEAECEKIESHIDLYQWFFKVLENVRAHGTGTEQELLKIVSDYVNLVNKIRAKPDTTIVIQGDAPFDTAPTKCLGAKIAFSQVPNEKSAEQDRELVRHRTGYHRELMEFVNNPKTTKYVPKIEHPKPLPQVQGDNVQKEPTYNPQEMQAWKEALINLDCVLLSLELRPLRAVLVHYEDNLVWDEIKAMLTDAVPCPGNNDQILRDMYTSFEPKLIEIYKPEPIPKEEKLDTILDEAQGTIDNCPDKFKLSYAKFGKIPLTLFAHTKEVSKDGTSQLTKGKRHEGYLVWVILLLQLCVIGLGVFVVVRITGPDAAQTGVQGFFSFGLLNPLLSMLLVGPMFLMGPGFVQLLVLLGATALTIGLILSDVLKPEAVFMVMEMLSMMCVMPLILVILHGRLCTTEQRRLAYVIPIIAWLVGAISAIATHGMN